MKRLGFSLLFVFYAGTILSMETPSSTPIHIIANRTGTIDTSCITHATLVQDKTCLAETSYTLQGHKGIRPLICATGPIAYQNDTFLGRITRMNITQHSSCLALLAFAIKDLKELHEKQNKTGIQNHTLYIDAIVNPESYESTIFDFFGFKKVGNFFAAGKEQHLYLLDENQELINSRCQPYIPASLSVTITENPVLKLEPTEEEKYWQKFFDDKNKETEAFYNQTPSTDIQKINPSELSTPIPPAAATVKTAFPRLIRTVSGPQPEIRKSPRVKKTKCKSDACPIHKKDLQ